MVVDDLCKSSWSQFSACITSAALFSDKSRPSRLENETCFIALEGIPQILGNSSCCNGEEFVHHLHEKSKKLFFSQSVSFFLQSVAHLNETFFSVQKGGTSFLPWAYINQVRKPKEFDFTLPRKYKAVWT